MDTKGDQILNLALVATCFVPAYGGSRMVLFSGANESNQGAVQILDVTTWKWTIGPPTVYRSSFACAVSGDHFIVWSGGFKRAIHNETLVYDMKTSKWVSSYTAAPHESTLRVLQAPTRHDPYTIATSSPDDTPNLVDTSSDEKRHVNILIVIAGALLTVVLTAICMYLGMTNRLILGRKVRSPHGPSQPFSRHPHAIVKDPTAKRNVQEGVIEMEPIPQNPHTEVEQDPTAMHSYMNEWESSDDEKVVRDC